MLITPKFVMINFPKTGSTFARRAIRGIHQPGRGRRLLERVGLARPECSELLMRQRFFTPMRERSNLRVQQHGAWCQIPEAFRDRTIMSVVRDPMDRLVSLYEYRAWALMPFPEEKIVRRHFPHFPDLSFEEFFELYQTIAPEYSLPEGVRGAPGPLTVQFIRFYARDPLRTIMALDEGSDLRKMRREHFPDIDFLHTENLNAELHDFLLRMGYPEERVAGIKDMGKVNTSTRSRPDYLSDGMIDRLAWSERFFYQLFPEYLERVPA
ncbi:MAG: sulfotransferase family 2 domain-containing protein [Flavobacteriales bacterium]|nr:sulfotransferase family 2 domain-containing protein [Flavobacteriales bacterium]